jgi:hypothetical protein
MCRAIDDAVALTRLARLDRPILFLMTDQALEYFVDLTVGEFPHTKLLDG